MICLCLRSFLRGLNKTLDAILVLEGAHRPFREVNGINNPKSNDGTLDTLDGFFSEEAVDMEYAVVSNDWLNCVEQHSAMFSSAAHFFDADRDDIIIATGGNFLAFGVEDFKRWMAGRLQGVFKDVDAWRVPLYRGIGFQQTSQMLVFRADPNFQFYQNHQWVVDGEGRRISGDRVKSTNYLRLVDVGHLRNVERITLRNRYQRVVKKGEADQTWK